ncbi:MAG: HYR domain-containing protein, partial [Saprospiraceae bacterium]|nr:HYR domain-containing protein [Saprospiraceae bacterium]
VFISGAIGGTATTGTWTSSIIDGTFSPDELSLATTYTPLSGNTTPFTLTLTTDGVCPATDALEVTYGALQPLVLTVSGPEEATCGDIVEFSIIANSGFTDLTSFQYIVEWDETKLEYVASTGTPIGDGLLDIGEFDVDFGQLVYAWFGSEGETLPPNTVLLTVTLKVISSTGASNVSIVGSMVVPIEAVTSQFCYLDVNSTPGSVELNPIEVNCPGNQAVCLNGPVVALTGGDPVGGDYSGVGVSGNMFNPMLADTGVHTITYSYTDENDCSNECTFTIKVNPIPDATFSVVPAGAICPGTAIEIYFNESAWPGGTEFTVGADVSPLVFGLDTLTFYNVVNGDHVDLTEGTDFTGDLAITQIRVTESVTGCSSMALGVT